MTQITEVQKHGERGVISQEGRGQLISSQATHGHEENNESQSGQAQASTDMNSDAESFMNWPAVPQRREGVLVDTDLKSVCSKMSTAELKNTDPESTVASPHRQAFKRLRVRVRRHIKEINGIVTLLPSRLRSRLALHDHSNGVTSVLRRLGIRPSIVNGEDTFGPQDDGGGHGSLPKRTLPEPPCVSEIIYASQADPRYLGAPDRDISLLQLFCCFNSGAHSTSPTNMKRGYASAQPQTVPDQTTSSEKRQGASEKPMARKRRWQTL
ncbi:hypothetical protein CONPUDRAFT_147192 [Coniophora puteana RWD-64-598 SS2]|uniref:Uncharacterized protein n=1 Tax=Coniophora puteana (strain RWD-64-598) TaxID=741705 RepID=A0A5M3M951_CONPW|nr:uncharacterized protein CONPUDRAFT_147192 [Coniophora puteana RWD-64-598 SS2]EIW75623.1 hypothetical protein CONPUDRAFT_147192 [Coniophora puteana RWD-64-598 SS2]